MNMIGISRLFPHRHNTPDTTPTHSGRVVYRNRQCLVRRLWRWKADYLFNAQFPGLIRVALPGHGSARKTRYATTDGRCLSALAFDMSSDFHEGYACVGLCGQGYGYLDSELNLAISPRYDKANHFSGGVASAQCGGRWYLIDRQGCETPLDPVYQQVMPFHEGLCRVSTRTLDRLDLAYYNEHWPDAGVWGYIDANGREITAPQYIFAYDFEGGIAIVAKGEWTQDEHWDNQYRRNRWWSEEIRWGGIDTHGREVIPFVFDDINFFFDRTDIFMVLAGGCESSKWGVIDNRGRWLAAPEFDYIDPDSRGSLFVFSDIDPDDPELEARYGIYDMMHKRVLYPPQFLSVHLMSDTRFQAELFDPKRGRIVEYIFRLDGSAVFPSEYSYIHTWHEPYEVGLENAEGDRCGLIDRQGHVILPCAYSVPPLAFCHKKERFIFREEGKLGVKDYSGRTVWPAVYDRIHSLDSFFPVVGHADREWPVTESGRPILADTYERIRYLPDGRHFFALRDGILEMYVVQER